MGLLGCSREKLVEGGWQIADCMSGKNLRHTDPHTKLEKRIGLFLLKLTRAAHEKKPAATNILAAAGPLTYSNYPDHSVETDGSACSFAGIT